MPWLGTYAGWRTTACQGKQWRSQAKHLEGQSVWGPKVLTLGEKQYFFGTPPLKAQND